ncbi:MAG: lipopolysaccharide assembly protein LapA domain-containing protein, partial [Acidobacteriota bacterium]
MSVRNFIRLVSIFAAVAVVVWIAELNSRPVTVDLPGLPPVAAPLWMALGLAFLAGLFLALLYSLAVSSREAWRRRREARSQEHDA